jgi:hypothetical protein
MRAKEGRRHGVPPLGRYTCWALYFAVACGFWLTFKMVEPAVFPVVKDFKITDAREVNGILEIRGTFEKVRGCEPVDVVGYSGSTFVSIRTPYLTGGRAEVPLVNRMVRKQTYGPWALAPTVGQLEIYARHSCATGLVTTSMFTGAIVQ